MKPAQEEVVETGHWVRREYRPRGLERSFSLNKKIEICKKELKLMSKRTK